MGLDWTQLYKKYKGQWIAFLDDEKTVIGSGKTLREALLKAQKKGYKSPIMNRMPETLDVWAGIL